jgi:hypothetical protein
MNIDWLWNRSVFGWILLLISVVLSLRLALKNVKKREQLTTGDQLSVIAILVSVSAIFIVFAEGEDSRRFDAGSGGPEVTEISLVAISPTFTPSSTLVPSPTSVPSPRPTATQTVETPVVTADTGVVEDQHGCDYIVEEGKISTMVSCPGLADKGWDPACYLFLDGPHYWDGKILTQGCDNAGTTGEAVDLNGCKFNIENGAITELTSCPGLADKGWDPACYLFLDGPHYWDGKTLNLTEGCDGVAESDGATGVAVGKNGCKYIAKDGAITELTSCPGFEDKSWKPGCYPLLDGVHYWDGKILTEDCDNVGATGEAVDLNGCKYVVNGREITELASCPGLADKGWDPGCYPFLDGPHYWDGKSLSARGCP